MGLPGYNADAAFIDSARHYVASPGSTVVGGAGRVLPQRVVATYRREGMYCMGIEDDDLQMSYEVCVDAITGAG